MTERLIQMMRLIEFSDSAFPVGTFSFSNTLESAAEHGVVYDADTLRTFVESIALQSAYTDGIAALHAFNNYHICSFDGLLFADEQVMLCKMNAEARLMTQRMGKKMAELSLHLIKDDTMSQWLEHIKKGITAGSYPVTQGILFAACGLSDAALFCSQQYGVINMVLSAALRCVRVSHYETQRILYDLSSQIYPEYEKVRKLDYEDMYAFVPEIDILASLHEKGLKRMFMN